MECLCEWSGSRSAKVKVLFLARPRGFSSVQFTFIVTAFQLNSWFSNEEFEDSQFSKNLALNMVGM